MKWSRKAGWVLQVGIAFILLQTLFFKLTYAPAAQVIFENLGGRPAATLAGLAELVAVLLLLAPAGWLSKHKPGCENQCQKKGVWLASMNVIGAGLALAVMGGAIATHVLAIGIDLPIAPGSADTDGGGLFVMAVGLALASLAVLVIRRAEAASLLKALCGMTHPAHHETPATKSASPTPSPPS